MNTAELLRMLHNLVRLGTVEEIDHDRAVARVRMGAILTGWLPMLPARAGGTRTWHPLDLGEQVVVLSPAGDLSHGMIIATRNQTAHPPPDSSPSTHVIEYPDGSVIRYDHEAHHLEADVQGSIHLKASGAIDITAGGHVTINGQEVHLNP